MAAMPWSLFCRDVVTEQSDINEFIQVTDDLLNVLTHSSGVVSDEDVEFSVESADYQEGNENHHQEVANENIITTITKINLWKFLAKCLTSKIRNNNW